ncbi:recombinase family protein [Vibrio maritimus]|uniref:recombinase family protein n=1 Tax=Vibrio maritimus TaxID=990268 RepID=UPI003AF2934A
MHNFTKQHNVHIISFYPEHLSSAKLERAELARLIEVSHRGHMLLIEKVGRLSRFPLRAMEKLK